MRINKLFLIIIILFTSPSISQADNCDIPSEKLNSSNIKLCENKTVKIIATLSDYVSQHPTGMHDRLDNKLGKVIRQHENYITFDGMQIVATYKESFNCSDKFEIDGTVDIVDLEEKTGKNSYKSIWIKTNNYNCID